MGPRIRMNDSRYRYSVYGIVVDSDMPLALPEYRDAGLARVELRRAPADAFRAARERARVDSTSEAWYRSAALEDGSAYVGWDTIGEFLVAADGAGIVWRRVERSSLESFQVYMLGQALSFALVKQRLEPLHATVVVVADRAVAFLGGNGSGKSSLAACFVNGGYLLLTDDLLLLHAGAGQFVAYPGPARIKLFPQIASRYFGGRADAVPMNPDTQKRILAIDADQHAAAPAPLAAIFTLAPPRDAGRNDCVRIDPLPPREALIEVVRGTFNRRLVDGDRLARQFDMAARISTFVPIKRIAYPRTLDRLADVRDAVLADVAPAAAALECAPC